MINLNPVDIAKFTDFLASTPEKLKAFLGIVSEWHSLQNKVQVPQSTESGPANWTVGAEPTITTQPLSNEQINALVDQYSTAIVKEKAVAFIRGFLMGFTIK